MNAFSHFPYLLAAFFGILCFVLLGIVIHMMALMNRQMGMNRDSLDRSLNQTGEFIGDIQRKLGSIEASSRQIQEIGQDISSLQKILQAPKLRGNLGEYLLYEVLKDLLPEANYEEQHRFKDGQAVDAVIRLGRNFVPVDSKFPMESFVRLVNAKDSDARKKFKAEFIKSVKGRIDEISKKYIRPQEGTFDFALMYIPAENVYYEILVHDTDRQYNLFDYAMKSRVVPVSPGTFYAYLMVIVYGLRGFKIEQKAHVIIDELGGVQNAFDSFAEGFETLGRHIAQAESKFNELGRQSEKIKGQLKNIVS